MSRKPSAADGCLIEELETRGVEVTVRQLERWRGAGLIETERDWGGEGRGGSSSKYADGTPEQVEELVHVLEQERSLDLAVLILFARGRHVRVDGLKAAYARSYQVLSQYGEHADDTDSWDRAQSISQRRRFTSHPVVRAWRKRIRAQPVRGPVDKETRAIGASVLHVLQTGEPTQQEDAALIAQASGIEEIAQSEDLTIGFADMLADLSFPALAETVESSSVEELAEARDSLRRISGYLSEMSELFRATDDLLIALVAPALIQIMRITGPWWEELLPNP